MTQSVRGVLTGIIDLFDGSQKIPWCNNVVFRYPAKVPAAHWRRGTRKLLLNAGTYDARTLEQWARVGRKIKAEAKPIMIRVNKGRVAGKTKRVPFYKVSPRRSVTEN